MWRRVPEENSIPTMSASAKRRPPSECSLSTWLKFGTLLGIVGLIELTLILFHLINVKRVKTLLIWFCPKKKPQYFSVCLHSDIYRPISFKLSKVIDITKCCIWIQVMMTITFIQGQLFENQKLLCALFCIFLNQTWMKFSLLTWPFALWKLILNTSCLMYTWSSHIFWNCWSCNL